MDVVYVVAGYMMGKSPFVHKQSVDNSSSALSSVTDIGMFTLPGLRVFPTHIIEGTGHETI